MGSSWAAAAAAGNRLSSRRTCRSVSSRTPSHWRRCSAAIRLSGEGGAASPLGDGGSATPGAQCTGTLRADEDAGGRDADRWRARGRVDRPHATLALVRAGILGCRLGDTDWGEGSQRCIGS